jgi:hypothetical protein
MGFVDQFPVLFLQKMSLAGDFSLLHSFQTGSGAYPRGYWGFFLKE